MRAKVRDTEIYFDIEGAGLVADGPRMREKPPAFIIHGGPGGDHSDLKLRIGALSDRLQLVYFDHRGQGRSARGDIAQYHIDENVEDMEALRLHLGLGPIVSIGTSYGGMVAMAHAARYPAPYRTSCCASPRRTQASIPARGRSWPSAARRRRRLSAISFGLASSIRSRSCATTTK